MVSERDKKITENIGLVHSIAKRFTNRGAEYDDIFQAGCLGLIKAVDNFDSSRGYMFSTYAVPVIIGEIKRIFRDSGSVKISRALKEKSAFVQHERNEFINSYQREPTVSELSAVCGFSTSELSEILGILSPTVSLSSQEEGEDFDIPYDETDELYNRLTVSLLMRTLNAEEQKLIELRYFNCMTQCETAKLLKISQVQVSRREKSILKKLKSIMNSQNN